MKALFKTRTKAVLSLSVILTTVSLICFYSAITISLQAGTQKESGLTSVSPLAEVLSPASFSDNDADYIAARREYLHRLLGSFPPGVSPAAYARNVAAARALPPSPLMQGEWTPVSPQEPATVTVVWPLWSFPILPPIHTYPSYGGDASAMVHAVGTDPANSSIVYAGNYGGLAKSTDSGDHWQYISDTWLSQEVSSIAVDPTAANYLYVGTGRNNELAGVGLYRSFDGGANWSPIGTTAFQGTLIRKVAIDPLGSGSKRSTIVYVANTAGLWRSVDSGVTWSLLRAPSSYGTIDVAIDASTNPSTLYTSEVDGVYRGVYSPLSQTWTWTHIFVGNWPGYGGTLSVVNSVPYLLGLSGNPLVSRLYKYSVASQQWTEIPTLYQGNSINPWGIFAVDPSNPAIALVGNQVLFRTTNATSPTPTWTAMTPEDLHADQRAIVFSSVSPGLVFSGNDGGIKKSLSSGASGSWANLNVNLPGALLETVALGKDDSIVAGTQDNGVLYTYQATPWNIREGGDGGRVTIHPDGSPAYFNMAGLRRFYKYIYGQPTNIWITPTQLADGGDAQCHPLPPFSLNPSSPQNVLAACQRVVRSTEGGGIDGSNWTTIGPAVGSGINGSAGSVSAVCEAPSNPNVIYAVANDWGQHVYVTSNAQNGINATWTEKTSNLPAGTSIWGLAVHATDPQTAYLSANSGVYRTTDTGGSWTNLTPAPLNLFYPTLALDPNHPGRIFAASRTAGIFVYDGTNWTGLNAGMPAGMSITWLSFNAISRQLIAATYGRGAYFLDLDDVPPQVSITAPGNGQTVSGTVVVTATASDNHRVVDVQFKVDGSPIGTDTSSPYSVNWSTVPGGPGEHTLTAVARDPANNSTVSNSVTVKVIDNEGPTKQSR